MKFTVSKTEIVKALSSTLGVVEKRQALPILSNILLKVEDNNISIDFNHRSYLSLKELYQ